jgi:hypothetical protein
MTITTENINKLRGALNELPQAPSRMRQLTKRHMVEELRKELELAQKRGYTLKEISALLEKNGMKIHPNMLGQYLRDRDQARGKRQVRTTATDNGNQERLKSATGEGSKAGVKKDQKSEIKKETGKAPKSDPGKQDVAVQKRGQPAPPADTSGRTEAQPAAQVEPLGAVTSSGSFIPRNDSDDI